MQNNWPNLSPDSLFKPLRPGMNPTALQRLCGNMFLQLVSHLPPARHFLHEDGQLLQNTFRSSIHHLLCLLMQASRASQEITLQDIVKLTVEILFRLKLRFLLGMDQKIDDHATILEVARMMLFSKKEPLLAEDSQQNRTLGLTAGENKMIHLVSTIWARPWPAYQPGHADEGEMENLLQGTFADFFSCRRIFSGQIVQRHNSTLPFEIGAFREDCQLQHLDRGTVEAFRLVHEPVGLLPEPPLPVLQGHDQVISPDCCCQVLRLIQR